LRGMLEELHEAFKEQVRTRRRGRLQAPEEELFTGEFWGGRRAVELGLADSIGHLHGELRRRYGRKVIIYRAQRPKRWLSWRTAQASAPKEWAEAAIAAIEKRAYWS